MEQTRVLQHMPRNLWRTGGRMNFPLDGLELYLPLWHPELSGSPIISKDLNAHSCPVTGTTKVLQGRSFDGLDDYIIVGSPTVFIDSQTGTIMFWAKPTANKLGCVFAFSKLSTTFVDEFTVKLDVVVIDGNNFLDVNVFNNGVNTHALRSPVGSIPVGGQWYHCAITSTGSANLFYINGVNVAITEAVGTADGVWLGDLVTDADQVTIGGLARSSSYIVDYTGILGDYWILNRAISLAEIQRNYLATKWRYQ